MIYLDVDKNNLASIMMAKGIYVPWRGQRNVTISVPYDEWYKFIQENRNLLQSRKPINYNRILGNPNELTKYHFFMFDVSWMLYNEVMTCANVGLDATMILPKFEDGDIMEIPKLIESVNALSSEEISRYYGKLTRAFPYCECIPIDTLSSWNYRLFLVSVFLQSKAYSQDIEKINIDWR